MSDTPIRIIFIKSSLFHIDLNNRKKVAQEFSDFSSLQIVALSKAGMVSQ